MLTETLIPYNFLIIVVFEMSALCFYSRSLEKASDSAWIVSADFPVLSAKLPSAQRRFEVVEFFKYGLAHDSLAGLILNC